MTPASTLPAAADPPAGATPPPGNRPWPLVGGRADLLRFFADPIHHLLALERLGPVATLSAGNRSLVFAFGAEHNRTVLSDPAAFHNAVEVPVPLPPGSAATRIFRGVMSMNGDEHRRHRRLLLPVVSKAAVATYADDIGEVTRRHLDRWAREGTVDLGPASVSMTSEVLMRCLFDSEDSGEGAAVAHLGTRLLGLFTSPWTLLLPVRLPGLPYTRFLETCEQVEGLVRRMIAARGRQPGVHRDVLSLVLRARDPEEGDLTDDQVIAHLVSMALAGHDPVTAALSMTLVLLSQHPAAAGAVGEELDAALRGADPTPEDLHRLPLLDGVLQEAMRLLPPIVHLLFRRPQAPCALGPHEVPAGSTLILSPLVTHRDPQVFPDPLRFDPLRWQGAGPGPYAYLPFGAGPRTCLGAGLSQAILRLQLAQILQRFRPEVVPGARVDLAVRAANLVSRGPLPMRLVPRARARTTVEPIGGDIHRLVRLPGAAA
ncbi:cytochrome P450 [Myxococcota bacterium]|nr:cytochrome P450 [Myxococcota bacterium]